MLVLASFQSLSTMEAFHRQHVWLLTISMLCHSCQLSLESTPLNCFSTLSHWKVRCSHPNTVILQVFSCRSHQWSDCKLSLNSVNRHVSATCFMVYCCLHSQTTDFKGQSITLFANKQQEEYAIWVGLQDMHLNLTVSDGTKSVWYRRSKVGCWIAWLVTTVELTIEANNQSSVHGAIMSRASCLTILDVKIQDEGRMEVVKYISVIQIRQASLDGTRYHVVTNRWLPVCGIRRGGAIFMRTGWCGTSVCRSRHFLCNYNIMFLCN